MKYFIVDISLIDIEAADRSVALMDHEFAKLVESLHPKLEKLLGCTPHIGPGKLPEGVPEKAVYLFTENGDHLYVGRTDRLRRRYREHLTGKSNGAPFAFKLARHITKNMTKGNPTRKYLEEEDEAFSKSFLESKERVAQMEFRWVEENDSNNQCLLEIYATIALKAKYNDFNNH